jgi:hypothetical protein
MICHPCREDAHERCPEAIRQSRIRNDPGASYQQDRIRVAAVLTGQHCDCQHAPHGSAIAHRSDAA